MKIVEIEVRGKKLTLETGKFAKQADGAVVARYGDTVVLATAVADKNPKEGLDFAGFEHGCRSPFHSLVESGPRHSTTGQRLFNREHFFVYVPTLLAGIQD